MPFDKPELDWDSLFQEAIDLLCAYIQIDTSNPPGNERLACDWLGALLHAEGIEFTTYDAGQDRVSLRAVLRGDGARRPFMLLHHSDVVPVERQYWTEEPFAAVIKDGHLWGRGALDTKGLGVAQILAFLIFKRHNIPLARDLVLFVQADEEAGSEFGMRFIERHYPETLDAEYVINEGGGGATELFGVKRPVYSIAVAEKGPLWLKLVAEGKPGHGSMPHDDNALDRLVRALYRVQTWERPMRVSPVLTEFFGRLVRSGVYKGEPTPVGLMGAARNDPRIRALLTDTISATTTASGIKHNVIPARAEATLDIRLLPGVDPAAFQAELEAVIDDPKVRIEQIHVRSSDVNAIDNEFFRTIEEVVHDYVEEAVVVPGMTVGFTDSSELRNRGIVSYGFSGGLTSPELVAGVHGHDERVSLESFKLNCQMIYEVTRRMCIP